MSPNQAGLYTLCAIFMCASPLAVALRIYARRIKQAPLKSDDYLAIVSLFFVWAYAIVIIVGAARGTLGTHTQLNPQTGAVIVTPHEIDTSKLAGISQLLIIPTLGMLKLSVVMLYRRIFIGDAFRLASLIVAIIIVLWTVSFFFATLFECGSNYGLLWKSLVTFKTDCGKYKFIQIGHAASDVATDLIVLSLPLPVIWKLNMTSGRKLALSFIFLLGLLSTAAASARLAIISEDVYETRAGSRDVRGVESNTIAWSYVEIGVGLIAACLPTLRPVLNRRTPESIVNSVRSAITLNSLSSSAKRRATESGVNQSKSRSELPLKDYEEITPTRSARDASSLAE